MRLRTRRVRRVAMPTWPSPSARASSWRRFVSIYPGSRRRGDRMRRREFIALVGGAAAWPLSVSAQQSGGMRRIGVLLNLAPDDPEGQARLAAFLQRLQELGWTDGR